MTEKTRDAGKIVLIDDDDDLLGRLATEVRLAVADTGVDVETWLPTTGENVSDRFDALVANRRALVLTDYDLTKGPAGFFGTSIVAWCQQRAIPVGDYSRGHKNRVPKQPTLFEFRIPDTAKQAAQHIVGVHRGFMDIRDRLDHDPNLLSERSPFSILAQMLERPRLVPQLSLYAPQLIANPGLVDRFSETRQLSERKELAAYLLGHLLFNSVLRYPGPILDASALCSYLACGNEEAQRLQRVFDCAGYDGPFASLAPRYWRDGVDDRIDELASEVDVAYDGTAAAYRRRVVEASLGAALTRYACPRCDGVRGGYRCPFTSATTCELSECSVGASAWLPPGADLCRVERSYYDEIAPMMGR